MGHRLNEDYTNKSQHLLCHLHWLIDCICLFVGVETVYEAEKITIKAMFVAYTADLQAKAIILEMIAHNGYCSCSYCDDPGHAPKMRKVEDSMHMPLMVREAYTHRSSGGPMHRRQ